MSSEFGKGLVICLVKFAEHLERHRLELDWENKENKALSNQVQLWFNAASDHLCEIEVPKGKEWNRIRIKVNKLKEFGIERGHGTYLMDDKLILTENDIHMALKMTREIALMIDRKIGLKPQLGDW